MNIQPTTVEILHDRDFNRFDVDELSLGIDYMSQLTGPHEIKGSNSTVTIANSPDATFDDTRIRWPNFRADVNIILTNRPLTSVKEREQTGKTILGICYRRVPFGSVILLDMAQTQNVKTVVSHEMGHHYGLKNERLTKDPASSHCQLEWCGMYPSAEYIVREVHLAQKGIKGWMERKGWREPVVSVDDNMLTPFCGNCAEEAGRTSFYRSLARQGLQIDPNWL